ncbi:MAG: hypothetical protein PHP37_02565, partial [Patescibacteria group bacterium]|nr:hypothetical protein [Patescibacteria group bacterium]
DSTEVDRQILSVLDDSRFFGPTDWLKYYGIKITNFVLPILLPNLIKILESDCPFTIGKKVKETHYLFCLPDNWNGQPLTIKKWQEIYPKTANSKVFFRDRMVEDYIWLTSHPCTNSDVARYKWYLMFEGLPEDSFNKDYSQQMADKINGYEVPEVIECVPMHFLIYEKNNYFINDGYEDVFGCGVYGRTSTIHHFHDNKPNHVSVGRFGKKGLYIYSGATGEYTAVDNKGHACLGMFFFRKLGQ